MYSDVIFNARDYTSAGDLSAEQYTFVKRSAGMTIVQSGDGDEAVGVLWNAPTAAGQAATVVVGGRPNVYAGAAIANGAEIASDANGNAVTAVATDVVLGYALHAASAAGTLVQVELLGEAQFTKA